MNGLAQILVLIAFLLLGAIAARARLAPTARIVDLCVKVVLRALLAVMGFRLGNDPSLASRLGAIGLLAGASAALGLALSIAFVGATELALIRLRRARIGARLSAARAGDSGAMPGGGRGLARGGEKHALGEGGGGRAFLRGLRDPASLLAYVALAFVAGILVPPLDLDSGAITAWILNALLFLIGVQFVQAGISLKTAALRPETLLVPLATALGSLAAAFALAPLFGLSLGRALALQSGFGWYSLSGVLIADLGDPALGSAAFLANLVRESAALLLIPFLARSRLPHTAISAGGATAMDVTLPLIEQGMGPEAVPVSFASGALLSLAVPILVPFFFGL